MADEQKGPAAAYVGWATFKNCVEQLSQRVPNVVDRTAFAGQSGSVQTQLLGAFKFLGLVDDASKPTKDLHALATPDEAERKEALKKILKERYANLFALDLEGATTGQLDSAISASYGVNGETREKAVRFFLSAANYADIPVSPYLAKGAAASPRRRAGTRRNTGTGGDGGGAARVSPQPPNPPAPSSGPSRTVTLASGGSLTVSATIDVFSLSQADREFVFALIDKLKEYEATTAAEDAP